MTHPSAPLPSQFHSQRDFQRITESNTTHPRNMSSLNSTSKNLNGKTILITGASSGIGWATALEFARSSPSSLRLILTARRLDRLHALASKIREEVGDGVKVCVRQLDVSKREEIEGFVEGLDEEFREVDVLVNNAYVLDPMSLDAWDVQ